MAALVREAVALSGLEGLGVPRVIRFGRLPGSGRPYLVREIVEGESLEALLSHRGRRADRARNRWRAPPTSSRCCTAPACCTAT